MTSFYSLWQQFYPPAPTFTEKDIAAGSQVGRVFIITGANGGIGFALAKLLYPTGATIYLAGRSPVKIQTAIAKITSVLPAPSTPATLKPLQLDLFDLATIKPAAAAVATQETRLDILWNNAGSGFLPGSVTKDGLEAHIGVNCVGPLLFTQELLPLLQAAARTAPKDSVRIVWSGSAQIEMNAPKDGVDFARIEKPTTVPLEDYAASKVGNWFFAVEGAKRWGRDGIVSVCENPGNLDTAIYSDQHWLLVLFLKTFVLYEAKYGAYTLLFAGFSQEVNEGNNGAYIWPWGRIKPPTRPDLLQAASEGRAKEFWEWCEKTWKQHV